jgi:hypothetical protein
MYTVSNSIIFLFSSLVFVMAGLTLHAVHQAGRVDKEHFSTTKHWVIFTGIGLVLWLAVQFMLAKKGLLADFSTMPSPFMKVLFASTMVTVMLSAVSPLGKRLAKGLSLYTLFGFQVFRIAVEILLMLLHKAEVAPVQMTLEGRNFDIVTGLLALGALLFFNKKKVSKSTYLVLNLIGLGLVINVVIVGFLSLPTPFQVFMNDNTWITHAPFVWLPTFLVQVALTGHILSFRKLLMEREPKVAVELVNAN